LFGGLRGPSSSKYKGERVTSIIFSSSKDLMWVVAVLGVTFAALAVTPAR